MQSAECRASKAVKASGEFWRRAPKLETGGGVGWIMGGCGAREGGRKADRGQRLETTGGCFKAAGSEIELPIVTVTEQKQRAGVRLAAKAPADGMTGQIPCK